MIQYRIQSMLNCFGRFLGWLGWGSQCGVHYFPASPQGYTELYLCDTSERGYYHVPLPSPDVVLVYDIERELIAVRIAGKLDGVANVNASPARVEPARIPPPHLSR